MGRWVWRELTLKVKLMPHSPRNDRAVALIIRNQRLLVIRRRRDNLEYYILPGGSIEAGETPEAACIREAREETSLTITIAARVWTYNNQGRTEHYFLAGQAEGEVSLGSPERERQTVDNRYDLMWIDRQQLHQIALMPEEVRPLCLSYLIETPNENKK